MKLSIKDRLLIGQLLPKQGKRIEMIIAQSIIESINFTSKEITDFEIKDVDGGGVRWNTAKSIEADFPFTTEQLDLLKVGIKKLDDEAQFTIDLLPLYDKILT